MRKILGFLVLVVLVAAWAALLWFVLPIPWQGYPPLTIVLLHVLPPLAAWLGWLGVKRLLRRRRLRAAAEREARQAAAREAALQTAKAKHEADMATRRFACQCRSIAVSGMAVENFEAVFPQPEGVHLEAIRPLPQTPAQPAEPPISQQLQTAVAQALRSIYSDVPAAMAFPIYVALPSDLIYGEEVRRIAETAKALIDESAAQQPHPPRLEAPKVIALPEAATPADAILSVFEQRPDLAGLIALAFDAPRSRKPLPEDVEIDCIDVETLFPEGLPTHGLVALCCTSARLGDILGKIAHFVPHHSQKDALTPYWEKGEPPVGDLTLLGPIDLEARQALLDSAVLASIQRSAAITMGTASRPLEVTQRYQSLLEGCFINGGLIETPFTFGESVPADTATEPTDKTPEAKPPVIGWLVHNAGIAGSMQAGRRLAPLGSALGYHKLDLNPVGEASNASTSLGDWGIAQPWAMLAAAVMHTGDKALPALCASFAAGERAAMSLTIPVSTH